MFLGAGIRSLESAAADATWASRPRILRWRRPALAAASTETFERFQRYPVEDQSFSSMSGTPPTAYYRDEFVGARLSRAVPTKDTIYAQLFNSMAFPF